MTEPGADDAQLVELTTADRALGDVLLECRAIGRIHFVVQIRHEEIFAISAIGAGSVHDP
jgi:hypothetical protein